MNSRFELAGPVDQLNSYPAWTQDMVGACEEARRQVVDHEIVARMRGAALDQQSTSRFMHGLWPIIERFPSYMALSLLKTRYGRSPGDNLARRWLVRNIRVEQNHAEYFLDWAESTGVVRDEIQHEVVTRDASTLASWCEEACAHDTLAAGMAATNYAIEGATGEWSQQIYDSQMYRESIPAGVRAEGLRWLKLHAAYDDRHPWEALEIICTLVGTAPTAGEVAHLTACIKRSYVGMCILADRSLLTVEGGNWVRKAAA